MRNKKFGTTSVSGVDFAAGDRQAALRAMHRAKVRPAAIVTSGWGTDVAGNDKRSVHAWLNGKGDFRGTWWNLYSRVYMAAVPGADLERVMYSFHCVHHALTVFRLGFAASVADTAADVKDYGFASAAQRSFTRGIER